MHLNAGDLASVLESDLVSCGWNGAISAYPGQPAQQYAMMSLANSLIKKFHNDETDEARDAKALKLFTDVNSACGKYVFDTSTCTEAEVIALGEAKSLIYSFFYPNDGQGNQLLTLRNISDGFSVGNGANIGSESETFYSKVANGKMSATSSDLHDLYTQAIFFHPTWNACERTRFQAFGREIVRGSRLSFVPKTAEISRTICTEPVLNMIFQKGIASLLEYRLKTFLGIDLSKQPLKNQKLCRLGSKSGRFGTIDLSSASDSMSNSLVKEFFPADVVRWLARTRSPVTTLPGGQELDLHMVSSMGNAFTFPLQTLFFSALVYGAYKVYDLFPFRRPLGNQLGNFAVFGDDIIVRKEVYNLVCKLLHVCGFTVNVDKSFNTGLFRESCGHDYYYGYNVRGVYIKKLTHAGDFYSAINRLNRWSAQHGVLLPNTVSLLKKHCRFMPIPFDESDDAGIKVPEFMLTHRVKSKFTGGLLYRFRKPKNDPVRLPFSDEQGTPRRLSRRCRSWLYNPDGLLLTLLHGSIRNGSFVFRSTDQRKAVICTRYSSRWDYIPRDYWKTSSFGEDWKAFTALNLLCE
jgi:hypothetical protein